VVAYAGIANPQRFFTMLESLGAVVVERRVFTDHHVFRDAEARDLLDTARRASADLVTTEKDLVRLSRASGESSELRNRSSALAIQSVIEGDDLATVIELIRKTLDR
jgi:tetraacyldisaccharide 4'-kinase